MTVPNVVAGTQQLLASDVNTHINQTNTNTSNIATNTTNISSNTSTISTHTSQISTANSNISTLQSQMTTANNNISSIQNQLSRPNSSNESGGYYLDSWSDASGDEAGYWVQSLSKGNVPGSVSIDTSVDGAVTCNSPSTNRLTQYGFHVFTTSTAAAIKFYVGGVYTLHY